MKNSFRWAVLAALLAALGALAASVARADASAPAADGPAVLEVQTVPALPGVMFSIAPTVVTTSSTETRSFVSGDDGVARIAIDQAGSYRLEVLPWDESRSSVRAVFSRWSDDAFVPSRDLNIRSNTQLQVGFDVSYPVSLSFVDLAGKPVDWEAVTSVAMTSSIGSHDTFVDSNPKWLLGSRVARRSEGLEETKILYSIDAVTVEGSKVVNSKQQRFYPSDGQEWKVRLSLYAARFTARDALFRFPIGSGIRLQYPDGHSEQLPFESKGELTVTSLPRGTYRVKVDALGFSFSRPVALSRDQDVQLEVISYLDIGVVFFLVTSLALGILLIGRPHLISVFRPRPGLRGLSRRSVGPEEHP